MSVFIKILTVVFDQMNIVFSNQTKNHIYLFPEGTQINFKRKL